MTHQNEIALEQKPFLVWSW